MVDVLTSICVLLALALPQIAARKYDVETEAQRLYGEDVAAVLRKFRRSTEYKQLLETKVQELTSSFLLAFMDIYSITLNGALKDRTAEVCGISKPESMGERSYNELRAMQDTKRGLRDGNVTRNPMALMDNYVHHRSLMSTHDKNHVRDIAFEVTGKAIHLVIEAMGPVDFEMYSTRQPFGGDSGPVKTTPTKDHHHTITSNVDQHHPTAKHPPAESPIDKTLRAYKLQKT